MSIFSPFELERGVRVCHDAMLRRPRHRKSDWDVRCEACQRAKAYVPGLTAAVREHKRTWG